MMRNDDRKQIRFIDSDYDLLFTVPNGGNITLKYSHPTISGDRDKTLSCRYIDECHFYLANECYHICQFAEIMERNGTRYAPEGHKGVLPSFCYSTTESYGDLILLRYGEQGYFKCNASTYQPDENRLLADERNQRFGITRGMEEAMKGGALFGWDTPAARTVTYLEDGTRLAVNFPNMTWKLASKEQMDRGGRDKRTFSEIIASVYPEGTKIVLDSRTDPHRPDLYPGLQGIVNDVDDKGRLHCTWENGSNQPAIPGEDRFHKDAEQEQDIQPEEPADELEL